MYSEDQEHVQRILAGESELFEALVRKYNRMAGAIAYGIVGDFHEAEDVAQEAFLKAFRALPTLREPARFKSWFAGLVRTKAIDCLRRRRPEKPLDVVGEIGGKSTFEPESRAEEEESREESRRKILEAIAELPDEDRLVVALKHMEGLSYKEIAEITGASVSAVESRLFRARQALRKKLDPSKTGGLQ